MYKDSPVAVPIMEVQTDYTRCQPPQPSTMCQHSPESQIVVCPHTMDCIRWCNVDKQVLAGPLFVLSMESAYNSLQVLDQVMTSFLQLHSSGAVLECLLQCMRLQLHQLTTCAACSRHVAKAQPCNPVIVGLLLQPA